MNTHKIRIAAVSYLNSLPFIYGLNNSPVSEKIEIILETPANCTRLLKENKAEIGLIPSVTIKDLPGAEIISDYCIGGNGKVDSVILFSKTPVKEIKEITLDYQSRTSVALVSILCKNFWKIAPEYIPGLPGYEDNKKPAAKMIIGDRAFLPQPDYKFQIDLSEAWNKATGLPFVFACWVTIKKLENEFIREFNDALKFGLENIPEVIRLNSNKFSGITDPSVYLKKRIQYHLTPEMKKGLELFHFLNSRK